MFKSNNKRPILNYYWHMQQKCEHLTKNEISRLQANEMKFLRSKTEKTRRHRIRSEEVEVE